MQAPVDSERSLVLVVDDNPDSCEYLQASLDPQRFELLIAADGEQGLQMAREHKPDAVLMDLSMPGMSGMAVTRALKSDPSTSDIPILILTVQTDAQKLTQAFASGADDFISKPFDPLELKARLELRIRQSQRRQFTGWDTGEQEALLDLTRMLASSLDLNELLHLVAVRTASVLKVDRCAVVVIDPSGEKGQVVAASEDASVHDIELTLANYPEIREVQQTRRPLVVSRVEQHPEFRSILPVLEAKGIGSIALFPMTHEDRVDGLLFLRSERFERELSDRDIFFAKAVSAAVALALRNVRIANELRRTKHFLENMIDTSVDAIIAADMRGTLILFNKGAERITGYKAEEVIGRMNITQFYQEGVAKEVMRMLREDRNGGVGRLTATRRELIAKNGEIFPIQITAWCIMENDKEMATAGTFSDLRERLRIETKLSQAQEKLMRSEQQAVIAELAGATAHELNQPLTSVLGYAEMAKRKQGDETAMNRIIDTIITEAERMADIVR